MRKVGRWSGIGRESAEERGRARSWVATVRALMIVRMASRIEYFEEIVRSENRSAVSVDGK